MPKQTFTETRLYPFLFVEEEEGWIAVLGQFGVTQGKTIDEAFAMAGSLMTDLAPDLDPLPAPVSVADLREQYAKDLEERWNITVAMVPHKLTNAAQRITLSLPADAAAILNTKRNKSKYVADLIRAQAA